MWLTSSSIGRKFVMAITGICLVLFVTFHVLMNAVAIFWPTAYNQVCEFLGANWYALAASAGLALLFIIHIIYALWLTVQNRKARGTDRYAVNVRQPQVEWSSKNMLVLGIVVLAFFVVHLMQFWYRMQWQEIISHDPACWSTIDGAVAAPAFGTLFIQAAFSHIWTLIVYLIGFGALWLHMNHGFWSMFHTIGWDNNRWLERLKKISFWWTSIVIGLFSIQAVVFTVRASSNYYFTDPDLQAQYAAYWDGKAEDLFTDYQEQQFVVLGLDAQPRDQVEYMQMQQKSEDFIKENGQKYIDRINVITNAAKVYCPDAVNVMAIKQIDQLGQYLKSALEHISDAQAPVVEQDATEEVAEEAVVENAPAADDNTQNQ